MMEFQIWISDIAFFPLEISPLDWNNADNFPYDAI
jgi:hypothetical protein